jgi:hypothetical protein
MQFILGWNIQKITSLKNAPHTAKATKPAPPVFRNGQSKK